MRESVSRSDRLLKLSADYSYDIVHIDQINHSLQTDLYTGRAPFIAS